MCDTDSTVSARSCWGRYRGHMSNGFARPIDRLTTNPRLLKVPR